MLEVPYSETVLCFYEKENNTNQKLLLINYCEYKLKKRKGRDGKVKTGTQPNSPNIALQNTFK